MENSRVQSTDNHTNPAAQSTEAIKVLTSAFEHSIAPYQSVTVLHSFDDIPEDKQAFFLSLAERLYKDKNPGFEQWHEKRKKRSLEAVASHLFIGKTIIKSFWHDGINASKMKALYPVTKTPEKSRRVAKERAQKRQKIYTDFFERLFGPENDTILLPINDDQNVSVYDEITDFIAWYNREMRGENEPDLSWDPKTPNKTSFMSKAGKPTNGPKLMKLLRAHDWFLYEYIDSYGGLQPDLVKDQNETMKAFQENKVDIGFEHQCYQIQKNNWLISPMDDASELTKTELSNVLPNAFNSSDYRLLVTNNPDHIMAASTSQLWGSCLNQHGGAYRQRTWEYVDNGCMAAYLVHKDDPHCAYPLMRRLLRPGFDSNGHLAYKAGKAYGLGKGSNLSFKFTDSVKLFLKTIIPDMSDHKYDMPDEIYADDQYRDFDKNSLINNTQKTGPERSLNTLISDRMAGLMKNIDIDQSNHLCHLQSLRNDIHNALWKILEEKNAIHTENSSFTIYKTEYEALENCKGPEDFFAGFFERMENHPHSRAIEDYLKEYIKSASTRKEERMRKKSIKKALQGDFKSGLGHGCFWQLGWLGPFNVHMEASKTLKRFINTMYHNVYKHFFFTASHGGKVPLHRRFTRLRQYLKDNYLKQAFSEEFLNDLGINPNRDVREKIATVLKKSWLFRLKAKNGNTNHYEIDLYGFDYIRHMTKHFGDKLDRGLTATELFEYEYSKPANLQRPTDYNDQHDHIHSLAFNLKMIATIDERDLEKVKSLFINLYSKPEQLDQMAQSIFLESFKKGYSYEPQEIRDALRDYLAQRLKEINDIQIINKDVATATLNGTADINIFAYQDIEELVGKAKEMKPVRPPSASLRAYKR